MFKTYVPYEDGNVFYMGNASTVVIKGKGTIEFTSRKVLTLSDVYHIPEVRKNLVSGILLNKFGFNLVFESNKFILTKGDTLLERHICMKECSNSILIKYIYIFYLHA